MIRLPETRAHRRAAGALVAYAESSPVLGPSEHADKLAGHLRLALDENQRLRALVLGLRQRLEQEVAVVMDVKVEVAKHLGRLGCVG